MIEAGTLLIERNSPRPECFHLAGQPGSQSWAQVAHELSPHDLEKTLASNAWTFFYLAGEIRATAFGFNPDNRMATVLKRLAGMAVEQRCNCLEIDRVAPGSFLGVPYLSVSAHTRHVQKGMTFSDR